MEDVCQTQLLLFPVPLRIRQSLMGETTPLPSSRETRPRGWLPKTVLAHLFPVPNHKPFNTTLTFSYPSKKKECVIELYQNIAIIQEKFRIILRFVKYKS
jgi:hypothetical protein